MKNDTAKTRILIADDHKMVRAGLAALLQTEPDLQVVGQAENGRDAVAKALDLAPDVVIMDLMMPVLNGVDASARIAELGGGRVAAMGKIPQKQRTLRGNRRVLRLEKREV